MRNVTLFDATVNIKSPADNFVDFWYNVIFNKIIKPHIKILPTRRLQNKIPTKEKKWFCK